MRPSVFQGEEMRCVCCGKVERSDPVVSSNWRCLVVNGVRWYACRDEFPPDALATVETFERAYRKVLLVIFEKRTQQ